jgi:hypothetical protein
MAPYRLLLVPHDLDQAFHVRCRAVTGYLNGRVREVVHNPGQTTLEFGELLPDLRTAAGGRIADPVDAVRGKQIGECVRSGCEGPSHPPSHS